MYETCDSLIHSRGVDVGVGDQELSVVPATIIGMRGPIIGSEAIAAGKISRGALRWNYAPIHPDVYLRKDACRSIYAYTDAAWLWTRRCGVIAGRAAAALHGVEWIGDAVPVELIAKHGRRREGVVVREERIGDDEVVHVGELPVTSPARTALDLARHLPRDEAVAHIDALAGVTKVTADEVNVLLDRYQGAVGTRAASIAIALMDGGARCPQESQLRLLLMDAGLPRPRTNILVGDELWEASIAMGWEGPKVGVGYDDETNDRFRTIQRIATEELFARSGWVHISGRPEHSATPVVRRVSFALRQRGWR